MPYGQQFCECHVRNSFRNDVRNKIIIIINTLLGDLIVAEGRIVLVNLILQNKYVTLTSQEQNNRIRYNIF
ncbi:hypothetical protein SAMN05720606_101267 [Paenibacillus polysaccharolyticus]|uniref:Uncharacterized protein n=1 Tax=Paenibacillus polysaccharolyticus TaxID=582692 RepID=A0A1G5B8B4_9BACL|nr:hypothetical protein SAMN05720606_101267 [Paenibacillus polysaccharolyticus]